MHKEVLTLIILSTMVGIQSKIDEELAITMVPVADLVGQPLQTFFHTHNPMVWYQSLPWCSPQNTINCPRVHQLLYNEVVTIITEKNDEVCIKVPHIFYELEHENTMFNTFWSLKKNFVTLKTLEKNNIILSTLPASSDQQQLHQSIVTLLLPHYDATTDCTFSAGTRFILAQLKKKIFTVYVIHPKTLQQHTITLPHHKCLITAPNDISNASTIDRFIKVLKKWTHHQGFIPYVWGGCSLTYWDKKPEFHIATFSVEDKSITAYMRTEQNIYPKTGFDCAGLIMRAAQMCNMPYYFKNTTTIAKHLQPYDYQTTINNGDLLWFPGHVMVLSDKEHHLLIEARSYGHGFGKVHELPIRTVFKNVETYQDLEKIYRTKQPLLRLDAQGNIAQTIPSFKLLHMSTIWKKNG